MLLDNILSLVIIKTIVTHTHTKCCNCYCIVIQKVLKLNSSDCRVENCSGHQVLYVYEFIPGNLRRTKPQCLFYNIISISQAHSCGCFWCCVCVNGDKGNYSKHKRRERK